MTSKKCTKCDIEKPLNEFSLRKDSGKYRLICKKCRVIETQTLYRTKEGLSIQIYADQIKSSKKKGYIAPDYTRVELRNWMLDQPNYSKLHSKWVKSAYDKMETPSCDRLNDYLPYTFDNLQLVTWAQNKQKGHDDIRNGVNNKQSKTVIQMTMNGMLIKTHHSIKHAARSTEVKASNISACCNKKESYNTAGGFRWMFSI